MISVFQGQHEWSDFVLHKDIDIPYYLASLPYRIWDNSKVLCRSDILVCLLCSIFNK